MIKNTLFMAIVFFVGMFLVLHLSLEIFETWFPIWLGFLALLGGWLSSIMLWHFYVAPQMKRLEQKRSKTAV